MLQKVFLRLTRARRFRSGMIALCAIGAIVLVAVGASPLLAQEPVTMWVDPATQTVPVNGTFTVNIVANVGAEMYPNGLGAYGFDLVYDPNDLQVLWVNDAGELGKTGRTVPVAPPEAPPAPIIYNENGRTAFGAYSYYAGTPQAAGPDGTVVLATVTLQAKWAGATTLSLENALLTDTQAANVWPDAGAGHVLNVEGGTVTVEPATTWYFAQGWTGDGFTTALIFSNPNSTDATVTITYLKDDGTTYEQIVTAISNSRKVVYPNPALIGSKGYGVKVTSTQPIIAEREILWSHPSLGDGGHDLIGATSLATTWYFAHGWTGDGFTTALVFSNPNSTDATVTIIYLKDDGTTYEQPVTAIANSRKVVYPNPALIGSKGYGVKVTSTQPIIAEREILWSHPSLGDGGHDVIGGHIGY